MTSITDLGAQAWRDYVTDGVPSSGALNTPKSAARAVMAAIDVQKQEAVEDLTALKALTSRPGSVLVKSGQAAGMWQWVAGSSTTADDALVVNPTSGEAGRYKRLDAPFYSTAAVRLSATQPYLGVAQKFGNIIEVAAANPIAPETAAIFTMTSAVGSADITNYFKSALAACTIVNEGSASGWAQTNVLTLGAGGTKRGGIVFEADLNNFWGNYTGTPANPYAANIFLTGQNTNGSSGGYASAAMIVAFAANSNPMWKYGAIFQGATAIVTATIADETSTPTSILITGAHNAAIMDWSGATTSGDQISGIDFSVNAAGNIAGTLLSIAGTSLINFSAAELENTNVANNVTKGVSLDFYARDTADARKLVGRVGVIPSDANWAGGGVGGIVISPETTNGNVSKTALFPHAGGFVVGTGSALTTTATDGFIYVPTCAGTPAGVPTAFSGAAALVIDSTNHKLYFYSGGAWRDAGP
ncbi:MAG: hypothetical protein FD144_2680 [Rhodospirillaceae bacterium]|nr:MAG: hypothetical protein FD144_2680 [Rhodospirillaceae bacterium]